MSGSQTFERLSREALEEHQQIHFYLDQVAHALHELREGLSDVEPMRRLAAQIVSLRERLEEHHQHEEQGGLFQAILEIFPGSRVEISRLIKQHERMIEILELARIHAQCAQASEADALRVDLSNFLEIFRRHERDEERLLERALEKETRVVE
ncbi:MAG TPA: hemerythrin domain-containing protein [Candidatus Polarisedimenticolaceae bacterium]|nr:hemerythrin domain-containing protein [Candidatus Polarisedimenticolaceae bacterium]